VLELGGNLACPRHSLGQVTPGIQELMRGVERVRDGFRRDVLAGDVDAALAACARDVTLLQVPAGTGATGVEALRTHLTVDVVGHVPADLAHTRISRTVDRFRVVDEERVALTHDRELPWLLPGLAPTGLRAEVLTITVVTVRQARIVALRALWDHTGLLAQLGAAPDAVPLGAAIPTRAGPASWW
jgi:carboxymethylenebutenolidase